MKYFLSLIVSTIVLTGCGGGGGGGSTTSNSLPASGLQLVTTATPTYNTSYNTAVGDLNGDGLEDVVVSGWLYDSSTSYIWVFTQNSDGTLTNNTTSLLGTNTHPGSQHVFIADFDGDGHNDIFLPGFRDGSAMPPTHSTMFWGGAGNFTQYTFPDLVMAHGACIDDVNSDGRIDMVVAGGGIYYNNGNRNFTLDSTVLNGNNYFSACAVMHQANGDVNIVLGNNNAVVGFNDNINVYNNSMVFQSFVGLTRNTAGSGDLINAIAVDINGDGVKDLVTMYNSNSARDVWLNTGNNLYTYSTTLDTLGNDYYSYVTTIGGQTMALFPGNDVGTRLYVVNNGLTVYRSTAFTDMKAGKVAQSAAVYRNTSTNKAYMLQLLDTSFYSKEL